MGRGQGSGRSNKSGGGGDAVTSQTTSATSGGTSALSADEAAKVQGMRNIIAQKGASAKQAAEQKLTQLERQLKQTKELLLEEQKLIKVPGSRKIGDLQKSIDQAKKEIPQMESMIRIIKDALK